MTKACWWCECCGQYSAPAQLRSSLYAAVYAASPPGDDPCRWFLIWVCPRHLPEYEVFMMNEILLRGSKIIWPPPGEWAWT